MLKPIPEVMTVPKFEGGGVLCFHEREAPGTGLMLLQVGASVLCGSVSGQFFDGS